MSACERMRVCARLISCNLQTLQIADVSAVAIAAALPLDIILGFLFDQSDAFENVGDVVDASGEQPDREYTPPPSLPPKYPPPPPSLPLPGVGSD